MRTLKVTVKRSRWIHLPTDNLSQSSLLRSKDNKMCCLGFMALACRLTRDAIMNRGDPIDVLPSRMKKSFASRLLEGGEYILTKDITNTIITTNDDGHMSESKKERKLKKLFAKIRVDINFVD